MTRTQVQLPDALYQRARQFAAEREVSLAELTRRGLELLLARFPSEPIPRGRRWKLPQVGGAVIKVPLARLRDVAADEETSRSLRRR